ncbi:MAG: L,D-transpeptidase family protein [Oleiphilaceae bacterium]|nr:L,D-transpeptidase family protein [Oleiphilaceae bacterium]
MKLPAPFGTVLLLIACLLPSAALASDNLRLRFNALDSGFPLMAADQPLKATEPLQRFYQSQGFRLAWWQEGALSPQARELLAAVDDAGDQGLNPEDYHHAAIRARLDSARDNTLAERARVDLDLLLSESFIVLAAHLSRGKVNPETIDPEWFAARHNQDLEHLLASALAEGTVRHHLAALSPVHPQFRALKEARSQLARLRQEPWPTLTASGLIRPGQESALIPDLRQRLRLLGDLKTGSVESAPSTAVEPSTGEEPSTEVPEPSAGESTPPASQPLDPSLTAALERFQNRHGLEPDGIIGPATLAALNVTPEQRLKQLDVNLERWRWLPRHLGDRYVLVNIAGFTLSYVEGEKTVLKQRVIVGRDYRRTPVFSDQIRYLEFNPTWIVPPSLAVRDQLPQIRNDPDYLQRLGFHVYSGWGAERETIDPASVDWQSVSPRDFPYRLVQQPGPENALGQVKFMFPNRFNVYLHDTPARDLFRQANRAFSSGCVRVEDPMTLAQTLLGRDPSWTRERIDALVASGRTQAVNLRETVPVHIQYWTAWADEDGTLQLRRDLYNRDGPLGQALNASVL